MKAKFDISLGHHKNFTALSNMPVLSSQPMYVICHSSRATLFFFSLNAIYIFIWFLFLFSANKSDWVLDKFDVTVPMSTYLVAYTINDFEFRESPADGDVVFRIWARRDAISQVKQYKYDTRITMRQITKLQKL